MRQIRTKPMFGGLGIYAADLFFALADDGKLYFKVDSSNQADFESAGMEPFIPWDGAKPMRYWELPVHVLDDPAELAVWIDKALRVAENNRKPKRKS